MTMVRPFLLSSINPYPAASVAARAHAETEFPRESVGLILKESGEYVPLENTSEEPENAFEISASDEIFYQGQIEAVIHSHCLRKGEFDPKDGPMAKGPSAADMAQQQQMSCPWGLVVVVDSHALEPVFWGDQLPNVAPMLARPFIHGIFDCYSAIRDSYRTDAFGFVRQYYDADSIVLPDCPRSYEWWGVEQAGQVVGRTANLYSDNFEKAGFRRISRDQARAGDVFLAQFGSDVPNHGGVYLGNGQAYHHVRRRCSKREGLGFWMDSITHFLRYAG